jgi:hypothetical protein
MSHRLSLPVAALGALCAISLVSIPSLSQSRTTPAPVAKKWTAPRTAWGEPDLQGSYTNTSENGTPLERPDAFEGRKLEDIKGDELLAIKKEAQRRTVETFQGPLHAPDGWWQPDLNMTDGSQAWLITDPPNGKIPPLTPEATKRAAARAAARRSSGRGPADSWEDRSLYDRCITRGLPGSMMPAIYGNGYQIVQAPGFVTIIYEMIHETRVIPIDSRPHVSSQVRSYMGDARGRWDGDTLVVETANFREEGIYRNANPETFRLVERFQRTSPNTVKWTVTIDDPSTWTKPWTFSMPLTKDDTGPVLEYACHEGNRGLMDILSAARAEEKAAEETKKRNAK